MIFEDEHALAEHFKMEWSDVVELVGKNYWQIIPDPVDPRYEMILVDDSQAQRLRRFSQGRARQRAITQAARQAAEAAKRKEADIERRLSDRRREQVRAMHGVSSTRRRPGPR